MMSKNPIRKSSRAIGLFQGLFLGVFLMTNTLHSSADQALNSAELESAVKPAIQEMEEGIAGLQSIVTVSLNDDEAHTPPNTMVSASSNTSLDTQFYIGSLTKPMTAFMMLKTLQMLRPGEDLKKVIEEKISVVFKDFPIIKDLQEAGAIWVNDARIRDVLTHQLGIGDYLEDFEGGINVPDVFDRPRDPVVLLSSVSYDPSIEYAYSNSNSLLTALLIEQAHGRNFSDLFQEMIASPVGMISSFAPVQGCYADLKERPEFSNLATNDGLTIGKEANHIMFIEMSNALGAGNVISTAGDLLKWGHYLLSTAPTEIRDVMFAHYGIDNEGEIVNLSFGTGDTSYGQIIAHQGALDDFASFIGLIPSQNAVIVFLTNKSGNHSDSNRPSIHLHNHVNEWLGVED